MGKKITPEQFLEHHSSANFQTKKIAGCEDLEEAKNIIRSQYLLAGTVEQFHEFLVLLADKLERPLDLFIYRRQNEGAPGSDIEISDRFLDALRTRNQIDTDLYKWVRDDLKTEYISSFKADFSASLTRFEELQQTRQPSGILPAIDFFYRNLYWKPLTGTIRRFHGLPYSGSYGSSGPHPR